MVDMDAAQVRKNKSKSLLFVGVAFVILLIGLYIILVISKATGIPFILFIILTPFAFPSIINYKEKSLGKMFVDLNNENYSPHELAAGRLRYHLLRNVSVESIDINLIVYDDVGKGKVERPIVLYEKLLYSIPINQRVDSGDYDMQFSFYVPSFAEIESEYQNTKQTIFNDMTSDIVKKGMYIFGRMNLASKKSEDMFIHINPKKWKIVTYVRTSEKFTRLKAKTNFNVSGSSQFDIQESKNQMY